MIKPHLMTPNEIIFVSVGNYTVCIDPISTYILNFQSRWTAVRRFLEAYD